MSGPDNGLHGRQPQAIRTALAVLTLVAERGPGVSAKDVSSTLQLPPATSYTILNLLVTEGYLQRLSEPPGFSFGTRFEHVLRAAAASIGRTTSTTTSTTTEDTLNGHDDHEATGVRP